MGIMLCLRRIVSPAIFALMFFACITGNAQHNNPLYSDYKPYASNPGVYFGNDCTSLFYDTTGHSKIRFKAVVLKLYTATDSTFINKKLASKTTVTFDKKGKKELAIRIDSSARIVDSVRDIYDAKGNKIRETEYSVVNSMEWLQLVSDEVINWDSKGNLLLDSVVKRNDEMSETNMKEYKTILSKFTYDDSNNIKSSVYIDGDDTSTMKYWKDGMNTVIEQKTHVGKTLSSGYERINAAGNETESYRISGGDTILLKSTYNSLNRITEADQYLNGRLAHMISTDYQKDGGYIETEQEISNENGVSCPNNTKTVTTFNKDSLEISKVAVEENEGRPITTKTIHYYLFNNKQILTDSAVTTKFGYLYSATSIQLTSHKYDAKGRILETAKMGGGETADNSKETLRYNKAGNLLEEDTYGSCMDKAYMAEKFMYGADGKRVIEHSTEQGDTKTIIFFGEDTRYAEEVDVTPVNNFELLYEYVK